MRATLLPFTIRNAARLRFYRELWDGVDPGSVSGHDDLRRLPTLDKATYAAGLMWDPEATRGASYCTHSTGTTGELTWRHRSQAEVELLNRVLASRAPVGDPPLVLALQYQRHGMALPMSSASVVLPASLTDDTELGQLVEMLAVELAVRGPARRATVLTGQAADVAILAQALLESGRTDLAGSILRVVLGGRVGPTVSDLLTRVFAGAVQVERYSLSEVLGGASRVGLDGCLRLDGHVIGEVLAPDGSPAPVGSPGELTLTELFPMVQLQPLVRYRTGDVVEAAGGGDLHLDGFRWLGRDRDCLPTHLGWMLRRSALLDWLEGQPVVARLSFRRHLRTVRNLDIFEPCLRVSMPTPTTVELLVGVRANPWVDRAALEPLVTGLWQVLSRVLTTGPDVGVRLGLLGVTGSVEDFDSRPDEGARWLAPTLAAGPPPVLADR